jgi:hypothetical protein
MLLCLVALVLAGCSSVPRDATDRFVIEGAEYGRAFETSRRLLLECRFDLERVDARGGVLTTTPKSTAGLATPWDLEQTSLDSELADLANEQRRRVRITFAPVRDPEEGDDPLGAPIPDVRRVEGPVEVRVSVFLERMRFPGWRLNSALIGLSSTTRDPEMVARDIEPRHVQTIRRDDALSTRLARTIERRLERAR